MLQPHEATIYTRLCRCCRSLHNRRKTFRVCARASILCPDNVDVSLSKYRGRIDRESSIYFQVENYICCADHWSGSISLSHAHAVILTFSRKNYALKIIGANSRRLFKCVGRGKKISVIDKYGNKAFDIRILTVTIQIHARKKQVLARGLDWNYNQLARWIMYGFARQR